jgi:hypothetical protein
LGEACFSEGLAAEAKTQRRRPEGDCGRGQEKMGADQSGQGVVAVRLEGCEKETRKVILASSDTLPGEKVFGFRWAEIPA